MNRESKLERDNRRKFYGSCSLSELLQYKRRLDNEIEERRAEGEKVVRLRKAKKWS